MSILLFESEGSKRCEKNRNNKMKIKGVKKNEWITIFNREW